MSGWVSRKLTMPSMSAACSCQPRVSWFTTAKVAQPIRPAATSPTSVNSAIGPQLRSLPTFTGATGLPFLPLFLPAGVDPAPPRPLREVFVLMPASSRRIR